MDSNGYIGVNPEYQNSAYPTTEPLASEDPSQAYAEQVAADWEASLPVKSVDVGVDNTPPSSLTMPVEVEATEPEPIEDDEPEAPEAPEAEETDAPSSFFSTQAGEDPHASGAEVTTEVTESAPSGDADVAGDTESASVEPPPGD